MAPAYQNEWLCDELAEELEAQAEELEALKVAHEELKVAHEKVQAENKRLKEGVVSTPKVFTPPVLCFDIMDMVGEKVAEVRERRALEEHRKKYRAVVEEQQIPHSGKEMRDLMVNASEGVQMLIYRKAFERQIEDELYNRAHHPELAMDDDDENFYPYFEERVNGFKDTYEMRCYQSEVLYSDDWQGKGGWDAMGKHFGIGWRWDPAIGWIRE